MEFQISVMTTLLCPDHATVLPVQAEDKMNK